MIGTFISVNNKLAHRVRAFGSHGLEMQKGVGRTQDTEVHENKRQVGIFGLEWKKVEVTLDIVMMCLNGHQACCVGQDRLPALSHRR